MGISIRAVRLQAPSSNTTQDYAVSGFGDVDGIIVIAALAGLDADADHVRQSSGFWDTINYATWSQNQDHGEPIATANVRKHHSTSNIVQLMDEGGDVRTATVATTTDGVTLTWAGTTSVQPYVLVILIGGTNGIAVGTVTPSSTDLGTVNETGLGITPKVIFGGMNGLNIIDSASGSNHHSFGFAYDNGATIDQHCQGRVLSTSAFVSGILESDRVAVDMDTPRVRASYEITAMASGQFTLKSYDEAVSTPETSDFFYLAIDFNEEAAIFNAQFPTTSVDFVPYTGGSITPASTIMMPSFRRALDVRIVGLEPAHMGIYIADGTNEYQISTVSEDTPAVNTNCSGRTEESLFGQGQGGGSPGYEASNPIFSAGSITFDSDEPGFNPSSNSEYVLGIAFEEAAAGGASLVPASFSQQMVRF